MHVEGHFDVCVVFETWHELRARCFWSCRGPANVSVPWNMVLSAMQTMLLHLCNKCHFLDSRSNRLASQIICCCEKLWSHLEPAMCPALNTAECPMNKCVMLHDGWDVHTASPQRCSICIEPGCACSSSMLYSADDNIMQTVQPMRHSNCRTLLTLRCLSRFSRMLPAPAAASSRGAQRSAPGSTGLARSDPNDIDSTCRSSAIAG